MHQMEEEFVKGAVKLGHSETKAKEVFAVMEKFAGYGSTVAMPMLSPP